jgi:hypothetical protein
MEQKFNSDEAVQPENAALKVRFLNNFKLAA